MTQPKDINQMERPRRKFAAPAFLSCLNDQCREAEEEDRVRVFQRLAALAEAKATGRPLPPPEGPIEDMGLRVVTYRRSSVRLECRRCGLRFSIDPSQVADAFGESGAPSHWVEEFRALDSWNKAMRPPKRFSVARAFLGVRVA